MPSGTLNKAENLDIAINIAMNSALLVVEATEWDNKFIEIVSVHNI